MFRYSRVSLKGIAPSYSLDSSRKRGLHTQSSLILSHLSPSLKTKPESCIHNRVGHLHSAGNSIRLNVFMRACIWVDEKIK